MQRLSALCCALLLASCAPSHPATSPLPENPAAPARPGAVVGVSPDSAAGTRSAPTVADSMVRDSAAIAAMARDSALDAAMLDRIAVAHVSDSALPTAAPTEAESAALKSMFDIDVKNFEDHGRVKYWVNFFTGPARERMAIWLTRMPRFEPRFRTQLIARGLPGDLAYLPLIESGYSPTAVSRSRAVGMWQFMRATGKFYGLSVDAWVDERRDVYKATDAAIRYLADLTNRFGSPYLAAAAYNGGPGRIQRGLARMDPADEDTTAENADDAGADEGAPQAGDMAFFQLADTRFIRQETKDYVPKLIAAAMIAKQPERFGFPALVSSGNGTLDSIVVNDATGLDVVAQLSGVPLADLWELNPAYVRALTPPKRRAVIRLPTGLGPPTDVKLSALPAGERLSGFVHHARSGETLASLASKYSVALPSVRAANPGFGKRAPKRGEEVVIPGQARLAGWVGENRKVALTEPAAGRTHRVRAGETLGSIAEHYAVSVGQLRSWNRLSAKATIHAGQLLRLRGGRIQPRASKTSSGSRRAAGTTAAGSRVHIVRTGDTLSSLARRYGVTVQAIRMANDLAPGRPLPAGRKLTIPS